MLAADKQLLDAQLRDELQQLRRMEINNVVNRFQNVLTPSTLIAGFTFTAMTELEFIPPKSVDLGEGVTQVVQEKAWLLPENRSAEPMFYISATIALALALYVTAVASTGIIFGQRLQVQATAEQGSRHAELVAELNSKFLSCLIALAVSMVCVVLGARAATCSQSYAGAGHLLP